MAKKVGLGVFCLLLALVGCVHKKSSPSRKAPFVIKKVEIASSPLPKLRITTASGTRVIEPSVWSQKTLSFSEGMPQVIKVKRGSSLHSISKEYAVPIASIIEKNKLIPPYKIHEGQSLVLLSPRVHILSQGQDLYKIAEQHGVSLSSLVHQNKIKDPSQLKVGDPIILPASVSENAEPIRKRRMLIFKKSLFQQPPKRAGSRFERPVLGKVLVGFGRQGHGHYNDGINLAAKKGSFVKAAENGVVVYSGQDIKSFGNLLLIKHEGGWLTAYGHLDKSSVKRGDVVKRGEKIATVGTTGHVSKPQLHFEIRRRGKPVDPIFYLKDNYL
jgi:murein DD-endopeptidase MepM/ murein hydrolase activator NlpD